MNPWMVKRHDMHYLTESCIKTCISVVEQHDAEIDIEKARHEGLQSGMAIASEAVQREREEIAKWLEEEIAKEVVVIPFDESLGKLIEVRHRGYYDALSMAADRIRARGEQKPCDCHSPICVRCNPWSEKPAKIARLVGERDWTLVISEMADRVNELIDAENVRRDKGTT